VCWKNTVNDQFHKEMNKRLIARVHGVRPLFQESGSWYLMHNALVHFSGIVSVSGKTSEPSVIPSTLLPRFIAGRLYFLNKKLQWKGQDSRIHQIVTKELKVIREEASSCALNLLHERCKPCLEVGRDYTEWWYQYNFLCGFMVSVWELSHCVLTSHLF
jgi:hypothetical protein